MRHRRSGVYVYLNGQLLPLTEARISPLDYGYLYGYGVFETMRSYNGQIFRLEDHLQRLSNSAKRIGIRAGAGIHEAAEKTLRKNRLLNAYVRVTVSAGEGAIGLNPTSCHKPTVMIVAKKFTGYPAEKFASGLHAITCKGRSTSTSSTSNIKSTSFLDNLLARVEALKAGADEAVMMSPQGILTEGSVTNLFAVVSKELHTPNVMDGILPGVTRKVVFEIADRLGVKTVERQLTPQDIISADEAFLTNSIIEIMPLTRLNNIPISSGVVGEVTTKLRKEYAHLVEVESRRS